MIKKLLTTTLALAFLCTAAFAADPKAKRILIDDTAANFTAENVEDALAELKTTEAASARQSISETITGISYDNTTGVFSTTSGYVIPTTTEESNWNSAYGWGNHASVGYLTAASINTSAELAAILDDESGTGYVAYTDSPVFTTQITTPVIKSTANLSLLPTATGDLYLFSSTGANRNVYQYGYITAGASNKYISWKVDDADDYFRLGRQDTNILGFDIDMPVVGDSFSSLVDSNTIYTGLKLQNTNLGVTARTKASFWGATAVADATPVEKGYFEHIGINSSTTVDSVAFADSINFASLAKRLIIWQQGNYPIDFYTNNNERMRIDGDGKVNIIDGPLAVTGTNATPLTLSRSSGGVNCNISYTNSTPGTIYAGMGLNEDFYVGTSADVATTKVFAAYHGGGIGSSFFQTFNADPADAGAIRLGNAELITWEASPAGTDYTAGVDSSEVLQFSGDIALPYIQFSSGTNNFTPGPFTSQTDTFTITGKNPDATYGTRTLNLLFTDSGSAVLYPINSTVSSGGSWLEFYGQDTTTTTAGGIYMAGGQSQGTSEGAWFELDGTSSSGAGGWGYFGGGDAGPGSGQNGGSVQIFGGTGDGTGAAGNLELYSGQPGASATAGTARIEFLAYTNNSNSENLLFTSSAANILDFGTGTGVTNINFNSISETVNIPNLTSTTYNTGIKIANNTAGTAGVTQQNSPALILSGRSYTSGADKEFQWGFESDPGAGANYSFLNIGYKSGTGAWGTKFTLTDVGTIDTANEFRVNGATNETLILRTGLAGAGTSTAALDQFSPYLRFYGSGWKTASTAGSQQMTYAELVAPEQGVTNPIGVFKGIYGTNTTTPVLGNELFRYEWGDNNAIGLLNAQTPASGTVQINGDEVVAKQTTLGAEKITNGTFTGNATGWTLGTGWAYSANTIVKNADGLGTVSQTSAAMATPLVAGDYYKLQFTVSAMTVNDNIVVTCGGATLRNITANNGTYTVTFKATSTADLVLTPSVTTSRYTIDDITLKKITGGDLTVLGSVILQNGETITNSTDGVITLSGAGATNNENISFGLEAASNQVALSSSSGVTYWNFATIAPVLSADTNFLWKNDSSAMQMQWDSAETNDSFKIGIKLGSSSDSGNVMLVEAADINTNFGVPIMTNPTFRIQSADATTTSDFIEFYHNQTDPIIQFGNGTLTILDPNSNEVTKFNYVASAVNELSIANNATGSNPSISATGGDTNIGINLTPKGTGGVVIGGTMPADALAGDFGYDTTQKSFKQGIAGGADAFVPGVLFTQTADKTVNDGNETTIIGTGVGSLTLPANFWTVGKTIRITSNVKIVVDAADGVLQHLKVKLGSTAVYDDATVDFGTDTTSYGQFQFLLTCRSVGATGTVMASGNGFWSNYVPSVTTVDTTASQALDVTFDFNDTTGDSITTYNTIVEVLN